VIAQQATLVIEALDDDLASADLLGAAKPLSYADLIRDEAEHTATHAIFTGTAAKPIEQGAVTIKWQYFW